MSRSALLTLLILLGLIAGALFGEFILYDPATPLDAGHWTKTLGDLVLIRPLMLLIIPLVFVSVVVGVTSIGDPSRLGLIGGATLAYFLFTCLLAVTLGCLMVTTFRPGDLPPEERARLTESAQINLDASNIADRIRDAEQAGQTNLGGAWTQLLHSLVPTNIIREMSEGQTLGVIVFALLLGLALAIGGEATRPAVRIFEALNHAIMLLVSWVIWMAPIGVFLLCAWTVGTIGLDSLRGPIGKYMLVVALGLLIHAVITLPLLMFLLTRRNPYAYIWRVRKPLLTAFGTASSSATLPVSIESAQRDGGCSRRASGFVIPIGATVNMDGTALYEAVAAIFLFQLFGIDLTFTQLVVVIVTATLASIGAAGIPSAGLVTMLIVLHAVNTSISGQEDSPLPIAAVGIVIGVDRILDMCRTAANVLGDLMGARIITEIAPDEHEQTHKRPNAQTAKAAMSTESDNP